MNENKHAALVRMLRELFNPLTFRSALHCVDGGKEIADALPGEIASSDHFFDRAALEIANRGVLFSMLVPLLIDVRPAQEPRIREFVASYGNKGNPSAPLPSREPFHSKVQRNWLQRSDGEGIEPKSYTTDMLTECQALVLLGEPGVGKSFELKALSDWERSGGEFGIYQLLRQLSSPDELQERVMARIDKAGERPASGVLLYLDALDEARCSQDALAVALQELLRALTLRLGQPPRLRLTCRTAHWPEGLERGLKTLYKSAFCVATLQSLSKHEAAVLAEDWLKIGAKGDPLSGERLIDAMYFNHVGFLAEQPITLKMVCELPDPTKELGSRVSVFSKGITKLAREWDDQQEDAVANRRSLSSKHALRCATWLAALAMFSCDRDQWPGDVPDEDVLLKLAEVLATTTKDLHAVIRSALFVATRGLSPLRARQFAHQSFSDFLAARWLAEEAQSDVWRVVLLTQEGRISREMQSVASWLAVLHTSFRRYATEMDPLILLGPDTRNLSPEERAGLFERLMREVQKGEQPFMTALNSREEYLNLAGAERELARWLRRPNTESLPQADALYIYSLRCAGRTLRAIHAHNTWSEGAKELLQPLVQAAVDSTPDQRNYILEQLQKGIGRSPGDPESCERYAQLPWWRSEVGPLKVLLRRLIDDAQPSEESRTSRQTALASLSSLLWPHGIDGKEVCAALVPPSNGTAMSSDYHAWTTETLPELAACNAPLLLKLLERWHGWLKEDSVIFGLYDVWMDQLQAVICTAERFGDDSQKTPKDKAQVFDVYLDIVYLLVREGKSVRLAVGDSSVRCRLLGGLLNRFGGDPNRERSMLPLEAIEGRVLVDPRDRAWWLEQFATGESWRQQCIRRALCNMVDYNTPQAMAEIRNAYRGFTDLIKAQYDENLCPKSVDPQEVRRWKAYEEEMNERRRARQEREQRLASELRSRLDGAYGASMSDEERWRRVVESLYGWEPGTANDDWLENFSIGRLNRWKMLASGEKVRIVESARLFLESVRYSMEDLFRHLEGSLNWRDLFVLAALQLVDQVTDSSVEPILGLSTETWSRIVVLCSLRMRPELPIPRFSLSKSTVVALGDAAPVWDWSQVLSRHLTDKQLDSVKYLLLSFRSPFGLAQAIQSALNEETLRPEFVEFALPRLVGRGEANIDAIRSAETWIDPAATSDERLRRGAARALLRFPDRGPDLWPMLLQWLDAQTDAEDLRFIDLSLFSLSERCDLYRVLKRQHLRTGEPTAHVPGHWGFWMGVELRSAALSEEELRKIQELADDYPDDVNLRERLHALLRDRDECSWTKKKPEDLLQMGR